MEELKPWVEEGAPQRTVVHGFTKVLSGKDWVLTERDAVINVAVARLKPNFKMEGIFNETSNFRIVQQAPDRFVVVQAKL